MKFDIKPKCLIINYIVRMDNEKIENFNVWYDFTFLVHL
jgi:hypothetical protein